VGAQMTLRRMPQVITKKHTTFGFDSD